MILENKKIFAKNQISKMNKFLKVIRKSNFVIEKIINGNDFLATSFLLIKKIENN